MNGKSIDTNTAWVDPDDAPELTDERLDRIMEHGVWHIGDREVSREEGMKAFRQAMAPAEGTPVRSRQERVVSLASVPAA